MDESLIKCRIAARERARTIVSLIIEEIANIPQDAHEVFWDEIKKSLPPQDTPLLNQPMTNEQAYIFGQSQIPFGEFKGLAVHNVPMDRLEWYSDSKFQKQLVRYLNSPKIKQERDAVEENIE